MGDAGGNRIFLESTGGTADLWVRFTVPKPVAGTYEVVFQGPFAARNASARASLEIEVPEMTTFPE